MARMEGSRNDELVQAANRGDLFKVRDLLAKGADPNSVDANGMGPLLTFYPEVIRCLLTHGADPNQQRNENINPVIVGLCWNLECLDALLAGGASAGRASDHSGETALHFVVSADEGHALAASKLLLDHGADPNAATKPGMTTYMLWRDARVRGETPLHRAAAWSTSKVIQLLLDRGAKPDFRDANGDTALSWASWYRRDKEIIDQLAYEGSGVGPDLPR